MTDMTTMVWMDTEQYKKMAVPYLGEGELEETALSQDQQVHLSWCQSHTYSGKPW